MQNTPRKSKKNFAKQFLGKHKFYIRKIREKKLFGPTIRFSIYGLIFFFFGIIFLHLQPNSNYELQASIQPPQIIKPFSYLFYDQGGNEYNIFANHGEHGAPQSREYLFEGIDEEELYNQQQQEIPSINALPQQPEIGEPNEQSLSEDTPQSLSEDTPQSLSENATKEQAEPTEQETTKEKKEEKVARAGARFPSSPHTILPPLPIIAEVIEKNPEPGLDRTLGNVVVVDGNEEVETGLNDGELRGSLSSNETNIENETNTENETNNNVVETDLDLPEEAPADILKPADNWTSLWIGKTFSFVGKYVLKPRNPLPPEEQPLKGIQILPDYKGCMTPRGYEISHGASVLAYQQDLNTPDTCKIERRFCQDGKFSGTFTQASCSVNTQYSYYQEQFVAYNTNQKSDFIQPSKTPGNSAETLEQGWDKKGVDEITNFPGRQETTRGHTQQGVTPPASETEQTERYYPSCRTPRGETVKHGQFVKAYKHRNGFNDAPCEVQLRTCVVGILEGNFEQLTCKHRETSYIDRLNNYPTRESGYSQEKMRRILEIRNSEVNYQKELGNTLRSETLDKILRILDM